MSKENDKKNDANDKNKVSPKNEKPLDTDKKHKGYGTRAVMDSWDGIDRSISESSKKTE